MAIKVTLRQKPISRGRKSLYLDFYPPIYKEDTKSLSRREFLGIYLYQKPRNAPDKEHNAEALQIAKSIRQKRENELNKPEIYTEQEKERLRRKEIGETCFVEYFRKQAKKRQSSTHDSWVSCLNYLEDFTGGTLKFKDLNIVLIEEFRDYLQNVKSKRSNQAKLSQNSASAYFNKMKATLRQAFKEGLLTEDLNSRVPSIKVEDTRREYLTLEELNTLVQTPCNDERLKRAALFSALTGLRFSDIAKLEWREIQHIEGQGYAIRFRQKKTKDEETLPISDQAFEMLGDRGNPVEQVFNDLTYSAYQNKHLYQWIGAAGISKNITFHCFRHTFAVLQLYSGTDLYTVSKLLGHKSIKTTEIYAKIVDDMKRAAANKIKLDF